MGLKLNALVPSFPATHTDLRGRTVSIDAPNLMYGFFAVQVQGDPSRERRVSAHEAAIVGTLSRIADLAERGARSILILDGPPHARKKALLARRAASRRGPALVPADYVPLAHIASALGVPVVQAPHDAEGQASAMALRGQAHLVATTDWDALAMGAPGLLRGLASRDRWRLVHAPTALATIGASRGTLAAMAALMGCDYCEGLPGIGPKKALKLLARATSADPLTEALHRLDADDETRDACAAAYALLLDPPAHAVTKAQLTWRRPEVAGLAKAARAARIDPVRLDRVARVLGEAHGTRTRQARLAS